MILGRSSTAEPPPGHAGVTDLLYIPDLTSTEGQQKDQSSLHGDCCSWCNGTPPACKGKDALLLAEQVAGPPGVLNTLGTQQTANPQWTVLARSSVSSVDLSLRSKLTVVVRPHSHQ